MGFHVKTTHAHTLCAATCAAALRLLLSRVHAAATRKPLLTEPFPVPPVRATLSHSILCVPFKAFSRAGCRASMSTSRPSFAFHTPRPSQRSPAVEEACGTASR